MDEPIIVPNNNVSLWFRGHRNLIAILDDLLVNKGMMNATDIILGGCSSGGLGVFLNIDFVSEYILKKIGKDDKEINCNIMGIADSGFFYNYEARVNFSYAMRYLYNSQNMSINKYC